MNFIITPTYSDIFDGPEPELEDILQELPSASTLNFISLINAELYSNNSFKTQIRIFELIISRVDSRIKNSIFAKVDRFFQEDPNQEVHFFSTQASLEFIHFELLNYRDHEIENSTPEQELNFLKAYFIFAQKINDRYEEIWQHHENEGEFFQSKTWPMFIDQFELNHSVNPIHGVIRALAFFNYFSSKENIKNYLTNFLTFHKKEHYWEYLHLIIDLLMSNWNNERSNGSFRTFQIPRIPNLIGVLDNFTLDVEWYKNSFSANKKNYIGLKKFPLIKSIDDRYTVLNWNFFSNKIYEGLVFDFYSNSKINRKFIRFPDFKNYVAHEITEKHIFNKILKYYLNKKGSVLHFDDEIKEDGYPDAYYRTGKYIFLFEIKDSYFSSDAASSNNYQKIVEEVNLKYNSKKKGVSQLIKQIEILKRRPFETSSYQELKLKQRNLVVFPIIVFTDNFFGMPGMNRYLAQQFNEKLKEQKGLRESFQKVENLLFLNFNFLLSHIHHLKEFKPEEMISAFNKKNIEVEKKFQKIGGQNLMFEMNNTFETFVGKKYLRGKKRSDALRKIFDILEMDKYFA